MSVLGFNQVELFCGLFEEAKRGCDKPFTLFEFPMDVGMSSLTIIVVRLLSNGIKFLQSPIVC